MSCCGRGPYCGKEPEKSGPPSRSEKIVSRWGEALVSSVVAGALLHWGIKGVQLGGWVGWALLILAAPTLVWAWIAILRAAAPRRRGGAGVVMVEERRVTYMGPQTGGAISLDELRAVDVESGPDATWILREEGGPVLRIPAGAEGAEALPEALAGLPGFSEPKALRAIAAAGPAIHPVWRRAAGARPAALSLS